MDYEYESYPAHIAGQNIWKSVPPILLVLGTVGNCLSIAVLTRKNIRKSTTAVYLVVLAVSDLIVLYTGLLRQWIYAVFEKDIRHYHPIICKLHMFLVYFSLDFSGWILIAVTVERVVLVRFPHSAKSKCSRRSAAVALVTLGMFLLTLNGHILYGNDDVITIENNETKIEKCLYKDVAYKSFFEDTWPWIDLAAFCIIPFVSLCIGNIIIITKLVQSRKKLKSQVAPAPTNEQTDKKKTSSTTLMLFMLNTVYLISSVPVSIYLIGYGNWVEPGDAKGQAVSNLMWSLVNILMYSNNTFNFLLYCLSGNKFREEVKLMLCRQKTNSGNRYSQTMASRANEETRCNA